VPNTKESPVHTKFKELLHQYKLEVFHTEHDKRSVQEITTECLHLTEDVLKQRVHYHFRQIPDQGRAEIVNLINSYVREAVLPPVVEKLVLRQVVLEKRLNALLHLTEKILEALSAEPVAGKS
jgi:hypothetical protein